MWFGIKIFSDVIQPLHKLEMSLYGDGNMKTIFIFCGFNSSQGLTDHCCLTEDIKMAIFKKFVGSALCE